MHSRPTARGGGLGLQSPVDDRLRNASCAGDRARGGGSGVREDSNQELVDRKGNGPVWTMNRDEVRYRGAPEMSQCSTLPARMRPPTVDQERFPAFHQHSGSFAGDGSRGQGLKGQAGDWRDPVNRIESLRSTSIPT
ncbi:hypothetical protein NMY22_g17029 [Coprinellus aureogranulatus]|nr:hypothetical protein NMY22_g17029 [Coprinellus aureogranulatus]